LGRRSPRNSHPGTRNRVECSEHRLRLLLVACIAWRSSRSQAYHQLGEGSNVGDLVEGAAGPDAGVGDQMVY
jgi:hypothetical protein